jgi:Uri superfamily endonuclease
VKGSYVLLIALSEEQTTAIGSLKAVHFSGGYYAYVGSAMGGIKSRLSHHLKKNKKPHWHIDYFLEKAYINGIILCQSQNKEECAIAQALSHQFDCVTGFGSSDCKCKSHLFFAPSQEQLKSTTMAILKSLGRQPRLMPFNNAFLLSAITLTLL